jgi:putative membrane protein
MMWGWGTGSGWWMLFGGIMFILFWGVVIALVIWGVRALTRDRDTHMPGGRTALEIAKERYARGEITKEQFDQIKRDIGA